MAPPMMAPPMTPAAMPAPMPQPWQRASAVVGTLRVPTVMVAAAAIARMAFFMGIPPGCQVGRGRLAALRFYRLSRFHRKRQPQYVGNLMAQVQPGARKSPDPFPNPGCFNSLFTRQGLVANPHAPHPPRKAVPDPLTGQVAARAVIRSRRVSVAGGAVIAGAVIARAAIIALLGGDPADDGAGGKPADDTGSNAAAASARVGRLRDGDGCDG